MADDVHSITARSALAELTLARVKEAVRDPSAVLWTFAFPVFLALVLGFAFRDTPDADGRYIEYLMPGLVALNLMGSGVWGIGYSIVDQRRRRLIRQLATTPLRQRDYLLSYMLSRLVFLVPEVALLFGFGVLVFDVPLRGDPGALALLSLVGAFAFTGIGVLIAARVDSAEAAAGWANLVMTPMWLCSGVFFSYDQFPSALHPLIRALPLTALTDALRAVGRDAAELSACTTELTVLVAWTLLSFGLALRLFRWP
jgi:ABC-2 type transport system permease protein